MNTQPVLQGADAMRAAEGVGVALTASLEEQRLACPGQDFCTVHGE